MTGSSYFTNPLEFLISTLFSLGPYYIPTLMLLVFAISPLLSRPLLAFGVGFTAMYHLLTTFLEFGFHQADVQQHGAYFSTAFVLFGNILFLGIALVVIIFGFRDVPIFLVDGLLNILGVEI